MLEHAASARKLREQDHRESSELRARLLCAAATFVVAKDELPFIWEPPHHIAQREPNFILISGAE